MTKKASLKDAFVRGGRSQPSSDTAIQAASYTAEEAFPAPPREAPAEGASDTATQPDRFPAIPAYSAPASRISVDTATPPIQPPSHTAIQPIPKKKATFNLDASLHQRLKVAAAVHSREMVDIVEDALLAYLPGLDRNQGYSRQ